MAKKKANKRNVKRSNKPVFLQSNNIGGAAALLFAGACIVFLGNLQNGNLALLLIGFGSALMFVAAVLLGMAISRS